MLSLNIILKKLPIIFLLTIFQISVAQIAIQTSFEDYSAGPVNGQNLWSMSESGMADIDTTSSNIHTGLKSLRISSASAVTFQLEHTAFNKNSTGISENTYFDCWIKFQQAPGSEVFQISGYDLMPDGSEKRAFVFEFSPTLESSGSIKVYNGSSRDIYVNGSVSPHWWTILH